MTVNDVLNNALDQLVDADSDLTSQEAASTPSESVLNDTDINTILSNYGFTNNEAPQQDISSEVQVPDITSLEENASESEPQEAVNGTSQESGTAQGLIPENSPTLLLDETTSRFSGTAWYEEIQKQKIILAGLGGIGSYCAYNLARLHPAQLVLYDDDVVDLSNLSGQFYTMNDVGMAKVDAVANALQQYTSSVNIHALQERFTENIPAGDIMICGFDNMGARKTFFHAWKNHLDGKSEKEKSKCLFLDGRLSINVLQIFCMTGNDEYSIKEYESKYLFNDSEADPEYNVCSLKQTTYMASMIGALMTNLFVNFTANLLEPLIPYKLPFFTEYDANYMIFKEVG